MGPNPTWNAGRIHHTKSASWPGRHADSRPDIHKVKSWRRDNEATTKPLQPTTGPCSGLKAGQIVWLPVRSSISPQSIVHKWEDHDETFGHPVLVTKEVCSQIVEIRTITSSGCTPISQKANGENKAAILRAHLFIAHPKNHDGRYDNPDGSRVLQIKDGKNLSTPSYVRLDKQMRIERDQLTGYPEAPEGIFLDEESTKYVQSRGWVELHPTAATFKQAQADATLQSELQTRAILRQQRSAPAIMGPMGFFAKAG